MPEGRFKSRSMKRKVRKTPGRKLKRYYIREKPKQTTCGNCRKKKLHGIPRLKITLLKKTAKTVKRPQRAYGGTFCTKCSREAIHYRYIGSGI